MTERNYYLTNRTFIIKAIHNQMISLKKTLESSFTKEETRTLIEETYLEFEKLLPQLPYIGGKENLLTKQIVGVTPYLAFYKTMKRKGTSIEIIGKIIYDSSLILWNSYPKIVKQFIRMYFKSKNYFNKTLSKGAINSQNRKYPRDFVYSAIKGNGIDFAYGIDYTECGICKFFHEQKADELTPYMCLIDYAQSDALNLGLVRTTTIAEGHSVCDFRFMIGKKIERDLSKYFEK